MKNTWTEPADRAYWAERADEHNRVNWDADRTRVTGTRVACTNGAISPEDAEAEAEADYFISKSKEL